MGMNWGGYTIQEEWLPFTGLIYTPDQKLGAREAN